MLHAFTTFTSYLHDFDAAFIQVVGVTNCELVY